MTSEPLLNIDGQVKPLDYSETGAFGVTKAELKNMIYKLLSQTNSGSRKQRALFSMVLKHMKIRTSGQPKEQLLKVYVKVLKEMREEGKVGFKSGKTATYVYI